MPVASDGSQPSLLHDHRSSIIVTPSLSPDVNKVTAKLRLVVQTRPLDKLGAP